MEKDNKKQVVEKKETEETKTKKRWKKVFWFLIGWFTIPFITGGIWYDMFGGLDSKGVFNRILHPKELINALGVYTLAFILFAYLPEKYRKANFFMKIIYFVILYVFLKIVVNKLLW